jgi:hypothetical protein
MRLRLAAACLILAVPLNAHQRGITAVDEVARAYDRILNADFEGLAKALPAT